MDPISMIVSALVAGAAAACKETASQAIKDSYLGLKSLVVQFWQNKPDGDLAANESEANVFLKNLEEDPDFQSLVEKKLSKIKAEPDNELLKQAESLMKMLDPKGARSGKYQVTIKNGRGVQIGDHNRQINKF